MKSSQILLISFICFILSKASSRHLHYDHHHIGHSHYVPSYHHFNHHHSYYAPHHHIHDRTIHGHMTNVAPSASSVISPDIGIFYNKLVPVLPSRTHHHIDVIHYPSHYHHSHHSHYIPHRHHHSHHFHHHVKNKIKIELNVKKE